MLLSVLWIKTQLDPSGLVQLLVLTVHGSGPNKGCAFTIYLLCCPSLQGLLWSLCLPRLPAAAGTVCCSQKHNNEPPHKQSLLQRQPPEAQLHIVWVQTGESST